MKETIITVKMPVVASSIPKTKWWGDALITTFGNLQWKAIIVDNKFFLTSDVGTFLLNTKSFASGMMCDLNTWCNNYKQSFQSVLDAIVEGVDVLEQEIDV